MVKRVFDLLFSSIGLLLLFQFFVLVGLLIKMNDRGPMFYRGVRVGQYGKLFQIFKFRTMVWNAGQIGASSTGDDDPRITMIGKYLRRFKLDEFPQLLNVFWGEMSIVGPRPQVQWAVDLYTPEERNLLFVKPGLTDYASLVFFDEGAILRGSADPDRAYLEKIHPEKVRLGLNYVSTHTVWTDMKIILATLGAIVGVNPRWCIPQHNGALLDCPPAEVP